MTFLKSFKNEILLILLTGLVVFGVIIFNDVNRFIRVKEMKISLQKSNQTENNSDHMGLVMRYNLQKRLYENRISRDDADLLEMKVNSIISDLSGDKKLVFERYGNIVPPVLFTLNGIRKLLGKPGIMNISDDKSNIYLEMSYFYERNKLYDKALKIYDDALKEKNLDREKKAGIFLHQGFCYSILGDYNKAGKKYKEIINDYADLSLSLTAAILLRYIEGFRSEAERIMKSEKDSVNKGEKLYNLIAYKESAGVLKEAEKKVKPEERSKLLFYKARCMEELDRKEQALNTYQNLIKSDRKSPFAKAANRRIFIIGDSARNRDGNKIREIAVSNNKLLDDDVLTKMADISEKLKDEDAESKRAANPLYKETFDAFTAANPVMEEIRLEPLKPGPEKPGEKPRFKIYTSDGNIFSGVIITETGESILLKTIIGDITIEKNAIKKKESK